MDLFRYYFHVYFIVNVQIKIETSFSMSLCWYWEVAALTNDSFFNSLKFTGNHELVLTSGM